MLAQPITKNTVVTAAMLTGLPDAVQRYLTYTGIVGKPMVETVRVKYAGSFRMAEDKPWMPISAEQCYTTNPPSFHWQARLKVAGLPLISGDDSYKDSHGHMFGKFAGLFTIFDARGDELDQGTMTRYLNEMTWFPAAFLGDNISWMGIDDDTAEVTFHDGGKSVAAQMLFDQQGRLTNFVCKRYRENKGQYTLDTWCTPMTEYGVLAGLNLPIRGQAVWKLAGGDLPYADIRLQDIEYNGPVEPF